MLTGVSMGGATVLMASELDLPENVKCIVSDCPYTSPYEIIARECEKMGIPAKLGMPFVCLGARPFGNLKLSGEGAEKAVKKLTAAIYSSYSVSFKKYGFLYHIFFTSIYILSASEHHWLFRMFRLPQVRKVPHRPPPLQDAQGFS